MPSRRHLARTVAMQTLFEAEARTCDVQAVLNRNMKSSLEPVDEDFARKLIEGVQSRKEDIQSSIQTFAPQWPLSRMDPITRCILFIGSYELLYGNDAPPPVVMNEAIEIAKQFGSSESGKFVNGVLNALAHRKDAAKD